MINIWLILGLVVIATSVFFPHHVWGALKWLWSSLALTLSVAALLVGVCGLMLGVVVLLLGVAGFLVFTAALMAYIAIADAVLLLPTVVGLIHWAITRDRTWFDRCVTRPAKIALGWVVKALDLAMDGIDKCMDALDAFMDVLDKVVDVLMPFFGKHGSAVAAPFLRVARAVWPSGKKDA